MRVSVAVLAGGQSRRMGRDKAFLSVGGKPVIQRVFERVAPLSDDLILVTNTPDKYAAYTDYRIVGDVHPGKGSLGGVYSALIAARHPHCLIVACDMPFLNTRLLKYLARLARFWDYDVVVPVISGRWETMHAVYSKRCLDPIEECLRRGKLRVCDFFEKVRLCVVEPDRLERFDPFLRSFLNMNTPEEWRALQHIAEANA
ncbi:MAG: molybdenum cofactor guanylyltransferase [Anaerolineae bacterium]|nr:molybdenum cofactor guanylyltransferase [Anaerolineae bacterium]MDW8072073.1 molybdenum cofactor guanylyltransferase [Anaerolineae bacterium]